MPAPNKWQCHGSGQNSETHTKDLQVKKKKNGGLPNFNVSQRSIQESEFHAFFLFFQVKFIKFQFYRDL